MAGEANRGLTRRGFLRQSGVGGIAILGSMAGVSLLSRRAFALPSGSQNLGESQHQRETMEAFADTVIPGAYWPDTSARASAWGVPMEQEDVNGRPGAVQSMAWFSIFDSYYGLNPYFDDIVSDIDSCSNPGCCCACDCPGWGNYFKTGTRSQRITMLDRQVVKGGQSGILAPAYQGAVSLAKYNFFGGLVTDVGLTYVQFPCPVAGYIPSDCPKAIPDNNPSGVSSNISVPPNETVDRLQVEVKIDHTYIGDLVLTLYGPGGFAKVLQNRVGGSNDNIYMTYEVPEAVGMQAAGTWTLFVKDMAAGDVGTLQNWSLFFSWRKPWSFAPTGGSTNNALWVNCKGGIKNIPDYNGSPGVATSTISVVVGNSGNPAITDLDVFVEIDHTWIGDLIVTLTGPNGTVVTLWNRQGGSQHNLYQVFTVTNFNGIQATGNWTLTVSDNAGGDVGVIQGTWSLRFGF